VGWALGAILYEINTLPWVLEESVFGSRPRLLLLLAAALGKKDEMNALFNAISPILSDLTLTSYLT